MRQREGIYVRLAAGLAALVLLAAPASGQYIQSGIDAFQTLGGGGTVANISLPAGFFCTGSAPVNTNIALQGVPLTTSPAGILGTADTIVERLADADLSDGCATVPVVVRALNLTSSSTLNVNCGEDVLTRWRVSTCACSCGTSGQPITQIEICPSSDCDGCGTFSGHLEINVCLTFTEVTTGVRRGPVQAPVLLGIEDMSWCEQGLNGGVDFQNPFKVDTDCDKQVDLAISGTSNFHPGIGCDTQGKNCWQEYQHLTSCHPCYEWDHSVSPPKLIVCPGVTHEHCVNPVCRG